jgi:hypothetical protein
MSSQSLPGDELGIELGHMKWVWIGVFLIVAIFGVGVTPWEAIRSLLESGGGVGEEQAGLIAFVGGYTAPLTVGTGVAALLWLRGAFKSWTGPWPIVGVAGILAAAGIGAAYLGLGLLPVFDPGLPPGPPWVSLPIWVFRGYFNSYGWTLMICAVAIGLALALHADAYYRSKSHPDQAGTK